MAKKIGFIGLGNMGTPMSRNLLQKGFDLVVLDVDPARVAATCALGAQAASTPREVAERTEVTLTMLPGPTEVEQVVFGDNGLLEGSHAGFIHVDTSSSSPALSRRIAEAAVARGIRMIDAPVSGGIVGAEKATLSLMVGGDAAVLEEVRDILQAVGTVIFHVGGHGMGHAMKIINQMFVTIGQATMAEALVLGTKLGLDPQVMYDVVTASSGNSVIFQHAIPRVLQRDFKTRFALDIGYKDLLLASQAGRELRVPLSVANAALELYEWARAAGMGRDDISSIFRPLEKAVGVEVAPRVAAEPAQA